MTDTADSLPSPSHLLYLETTKESPTSSAVPQPGIPGSVTPLFAVSDGGIHCSASLITLQNDHSSLPITIFDERCDVTWGAERDSVVITLRDSKGNTTEPVELTPACPSQNVSLPNFDTNFELRLMRREPSPEILLVAVRQPRQKEPRS